MYGREWWDHVVFRLSGSNRDHNGRACLILHVINGDPLGVEIVVQLLVHAAARPRCVLTRFGCNRLKWAMDETTHFLELLAVLLSAVRGLIHIVVDFQELTERHGMFAFPTTTCCTMEERLRERFFINDFYPWTSNGLTIDRRV